MNDHQLTPLVGPAFIGWAGDNGHLRDRVQGKPKSLAGDQARRRDDLHLHQLAIPAADAVDGLAVETDLAPEFTDCEFRGWRDGDLARGGGLGSGDRSTNPGLAAGAMANLSTQTQLATIWGGQR